MPMIETKDLWSNGKTGPRHRRYRVFWPDDDAWQDDPSSKVFHCEMADGDASSTSWISLGYFSTKASAQKAADANIGYTIKDESWGEETIR